MKKVVISVIVLMISLTVFLANVEVRANVINNETESDNITANSNYTSVLNKWKNEGVVDNRDFLTVITPFDFIFDQGEYIEENSYDSFLSKEELLNHNGSTVYNFTNSSEVSFFVEVDETGLYVIDLDYFSVNETIRDIEYQIYINDQLQYFEAGNLTLKNYWENDSQFSIDRYGNDIMPTAEIKSTWIHHQVVDVQRLQPEQLRHYLEAGENKITIRKLTGQFYLGQVYVKNYQKAISYEEYLEVHKNAPINTDELITIEAENPLYRNDLGVRYGTDRNSNVTPFALVENRLNVIDGGTYNTSGDAVIYNIDVDKSGLYEITLKTKQLKSHSMVFRKILINNQVPFKEAETIGFSHSSKWENNTLGNDETNYLFYLESGNNTLTIVVNSSPLYQIYEDVSYVMNEVNSLDLDIKKLTGNDPSKDRDWEIDAYIPNLANNLFRYAEILENAYISLNEINETTKNSEVTVNIKKASETLYYFSNNPNNIPKELSKFSQGTNSVIQKLGLILPIILDQPLTVDKLYIHGTDVDLPKARPNFFVNLWIGIRRFFSSFFNDYDYKADDDEIEVWVNRSRQYVNLMQQMVDETFTDDTGIKVKISIMPNEDKLILATSSNTQPDVALGVAGWRPYDFAIRNALTDLRELDGFYEVADRFKPGAFAQVIYQEGVYALPETQNFSLLFYRHDILDTIGIDLPNTWQDVLDILPELQRYGYNFYNRLSSTNAFKAYIDTMPFINQFGGELYSDNLLTSNLTHPNTIEAINFMAELYTIYSLPLEVGSFYNQFRYGSLPIGIGDFGMYVQLLNAAPEIAGLWSVAPLPGVVNEDGIVDRSYDGASTSAIIFKNSDKQDEAWEFLKWWTSDDVQLNYAENLMTSLGPEYMWNTANVNAFSQMSWSEDHKAVIIEQWDWIFDTPKTPASYMVEREISNIWNKIVYDGINTRIAISDSEIIINKEITKKMIEFGFINRQNEILKPYLFPTRENIEGWVRE